LSGGERTEIKLAFLLALQRVAGNPLQVILMDEPFALLSEEMQQNILLYLAECGYQLIFTSNSQDHVADQVIRVTRIGEYRATVA
jgi:DNA repair exonuclease SbcCD ATPase subunit